MLTPTEYFPMMLNLFSLVLNRYSPDPNSNQILSIPLNFQDVTDLDQIHVEGNARLHVEHPDRLQRSSLVNARRFTQVSIQS